MICRIFGAKPFMNQYWYNVNCVIWPQISVQLECATIIIQENDAVY